MTRKLSPAEPATAAYLAVVAHIETLILARTPPLARVLGTQQGLTGVEKFELAQMLVDAARVVAREGST